MGRVRSVVFLVGASGVGKTTVAQVLGERAPWKGNTHYFDTIGIPSADEMESEFGGGEEWQRWATRQWVSRLAGSEASLQLIEGQTRPSFINEAVEDYPDLEVHVVLLDCTPEVRRDRLTRLRQRPELATPDMDNWAAYLSGQAHALGLPVIDTSKTNPEAIAREIEARVGVA
jgi:2-phosphoglycerate kinase